MDIIDHIEQILKREWGGRWDAIAKGDLDELLEFAKAQRLALKERSRAVRGVRTRKRPSDMISQMLMFGFASGAP